MNRHENPRHRRDLPTKLEASRTPFTCFYGSGNIDRINVASRATVHSPERTSRTRRFDRNASSTRQEAPAGFGHLFPDLGKFDLAAHADLGAAGLLRQLMHEPTNIAMRLDGPSDRPQRVA